MGAISGTHRKALAKQAEETSPWQLWGETTYGESELEKAPSTSGDQGLGMPRCHCS